MHYVKDIFGGIKSEHAHTKFTRYSKGSFQGPMINLKTSPAGIKVAASFHFIDELLMILAEKIGNEVVHIKGFVIWNKDLTKDFEDLGIKYMKVSKSRGIFKYTIDNDVDFKLFLDNMLKYNVLLNIKSEEFSFTTKNSFPKPNKEFKADFCKCLFPKEMRSRLFEEFVFDVEETPKLKDVRISHQIEVTDIIMPKDITNFEEVRKLSLRKGVMSRVVAIKNQEDKLSSTEFEL